MHLPNVSEVVLVICEKLGSTIHRNALLIIFVVN